jgi:drug/metabolite transporter (DMT)-like permease
MLRATGPVCAPRHLADYLRAMPDRPRARLRLAAAAVLFSTGGAAIKAADFTAWQIAGFRSGIAALALLLMTSEARRGWSVRAVLVGLAYAACLTLFVLANRLTTAANTIFLQSTAPLYLLVLGPWLLKEPVRRQDAALMAVVGVGLALVFLGAEGRGRGSAVAAVVSGNVTAFLVALPLALPVEAHPATDWLAIIYLGVFQIALAYVLVTSGLRHIPALEASLILLIEPVLNPVWAWLFQGERPGAWALAGGGIILGATTLKGVLDARSQREVVAPAELAALPRGD